MCYFILKFRTSQGKAENEEAKSLGLIAFHQKMSISNNLISNLFRKFLRSSL